MARLIKISKEEEKRVTHKECGAVIGYYKSEIQETVYHDYGGGSELIYFIICPNCGKRIEVKKY